MSDRTSRPSAKRPRQVYVVPVDGGWAVRSASVGQVTSVHATQSEATEAAKAALRRSGGQLKIEGRDGRLLESVTLGRDSMAKIAAVEGIHLSAGMKRTLNAFDRVGASGDERRRAIAREFGKKRS